MIESAKLDQAYNTLVFRTRANRFYQAVNICADHLKNVQPTPLPRMDRLEKMGVDKDLDFVFIPKQESKSKTLELIVTDPVSGIHISKEKEGRSNYLEYRTDLIDEEHSSVSEDPFGLVRYLAFNARKNYLAMYCDADQSGKVVLLKDLREELNRIDRTRVGGSQLAWCGNDCIVLSVFDQVIVIGPGDQ